MAKSTSNVLTPDLGRAQGLAVGVLCLLAGIQLVGIGRTAWLATARKISGPSAEVTPIATVPPAPPLPGSLTSSPSIAVGPPPIGSFGSPLAAAPPVVPTPTASQPVAPTVPAVGLPKTGALTPNAEVNELLGVVEQLRPLGDTAGVLDVLKKAEVLLPNHPAVLKDFAQTYDLMGLTTKAVSYWRRIEAWDLVQEIFMRWLPSDCRALGALRWRAQTQTPIQRSADRPIQLQVLRSVFWGWVW